MTQVGQLGEPSLPLRLIVGLGNPGARYYGTRHNIGFEVVDGLAKRLGISLVAEKRWRSEIAKAAKVTLLKPQTFMNLSGEAVSAFAAFYRVMPEEILVVLDDFALPLGSIRIRKQGSAGGHNGLESLVRCLGSKNIPRLRIGIGDPDKKAQHFVLDRFTIEEEPIARSAIETSIDAVVFALDNGVEAAMNKFNTRKQTHE